MAIMFNYQRAVNNTHYLINYRELSLPEMHNAFLGNVLLFLILVGVVLSCFLHIQTTEDPSGFSDRQVRKCHRARRWSLLCDLLSRHLRPS